jgi:hypothetical protein
MATITASNNEKVYTIKKWMGLNESPGGDTQLKLGEAASMKNFRITRENTLQTRHGSVTVDTLGTSPVMGLWCGRVAGYERMLAACGGKLYQLYNGTEFSKTELGSVNTTQRVTMFPFEGKVYILNGSEYKVWDGTTLSDVAGYVPLILTETAPGGGGTLMQQVNKLTAKRRVWFSPDGTATELVLPERALSSIDSVKDRLTGAELVCTKDTANGKVIFTAAPSEGVDAIEVAYTASESFASTVRAMKYAEIYSGSSEARVWLYGDGSNEAFYSGLDYDGKPRADYFPDMNEMAVGESNSPIMAMTRHFAQLIIFKADSTWAANYSTTTLADGSVIPAFYLKAVNKSIGTRAPGQARLVLNYPVALYNSELYEWQSNKNGELSYDERQAKRISDRIYASLGNFVESECFCWDDDANQEYYILYNYKALVHNYAADAWYFYDGLDARCMVSFDGEVYFGGNDGKVRKLSEIALTDDGAEIVTRWESGNHAFGADTMRKFTSALFVSMKPECGSAVKVSCQTERSSPETVKTISANVSGFSTWRFSTFTFNSVMRPREFRLKLKAKKFVYWKLIFSSAGAGTRATILSASVKVRTTGYAK